MGGSIQWFVARLTVSFRRVLRSGYQFGNPNNETIPILPQMSGKYHPQMVGLWHWVNLTFQLQGGL